MRTRLGVLLFAFVLAVVAPMGRAEERVWTGVLLASNGKNPKEPPEQIAALYPRLQRVFKCNQFELFGSAMKVLDEQQEKWLVPSQNFWLGLNLQKEIVVLMIQR
jgi:hypothetical protein